MRREGLAATLGVTAGFARGAAVEVLVTGGRVVTNWAGSFVRARVGVAGRSAWVKEFVGVGRVGKDAGETSTASRGGGSSITLTTIGGAEVACGRTGEVGEEGTVETSDAAFVGWAVTAGVGTFTTNPPGGFALAPGAKFVVLWTTVGADGCGVGVAVCWLIGGETGLVLG